MKTIEYLTTLTNLITQQPKISTILDEHGLGTEITFGCIGIDDFDDFMKIYGLLNTIKEVETTPIKEYDDQSAYSFTMTNPITAKFFYMK